MDLRPAFRRATCAGAAVSLLLIIGCAQRQESHAMHVASPQVIPDDSIDPGVGGMPSTERPAGDPLRYAYYGLPAVEPLVERPQTLFNAGYAAGYDFTRKEPAWVAYRLYAGGGGAAAPAGKAPAASVTPDARLGQVVPPPVEEGKKQPEPTGDFAKGSGLVPHGLVPEAPIAALYGGDAGAETHLASAVVPIPSGLSGAWDQITGLEPAYAQAYDELWVVSGPLPGDRKAPSGAFVPAGFYKIQVTIQHGKSAVQAFILPLAADAKQQAQSEQGKDLAGYLVSVREIEERTGLRFFEDFHDVEGDTRERMEAMVSDGLWPTERPADEPPKPVTRR